MVKEFAIILQLTLIWLGSRRRVVVNKELRTLNWGLFISREISRCERGKRKKKWDHTLLEWLLISDTVSCSFDYPVQTVLPNFLLWQTVCSLPKSGRTASSDFFGPWLGVSDQENFIPHPRWGAKSTYTLDSSYTSENSITLTQSIREGYPLYWSYHHCWQSLEFFKSISESVIWHTMVIFRVRGVGYNLKTSWSNWKPQSCHQKQVFRWATSMAQWISSSHHLLL